MIKRRMIAVAAGGRSPLIAVTVVAVATAVEAAVSGSRHLVLR
jgi:hypothetical protein